MTPRRPRRTARELEHDIAVAVRGALTENGYRGVSFEDVARRAGVSKPVLYRRYPDRAAMVLHTLRGTLREELAAGHPAPGSSTGDLRADLIAWFSLARERAAALGPDTYRGLVGEADPATLAAVSGIGGDAVALLRTRVIDPAVTRGELGPEPLPDAILSVPLHLVRDSIVFDCAPPDVAELVDTVALPLFRAATGARSPRGGPPTRGAN